MSLELVARGFLLAVERFREAVAAQTAGGDVDAQIYIFEALNWLDSLAEQPQLQTDSDVQGFQFIRHRTHHNWAAGLNRTSASAEWIWRRVDSLPPASPGRENPMLQRCYENGLEGRPVGEVLRRLERKVAALAPNAVP